MGSTWPSVGVGVQDGARWHTEANAHRHHHATSEASAPSTPFGTRYLAVEPFLLAASASLVMMTGAVAVATTVAFSLADPGQLSAGRLLQPAERARLGNPFRPQLRCSLHSARVHKAPPRVDEGDLL